MILLPRHYNKAINLMLILYINFSSLSGETMRDSREIYDGYQISSEEILRRRKLVEPLLQQIAEKQKGWLETYHMSFNDDFDDNENSDREKFPSDNHVLAEDPFLSQVPFVNSIEETSKQEHPQNYRIHNQRFDFDGKKQELTSDFSDKSEYVAVETFPLDSKERSYRHKIVENFISELKDIDISAEDNHEILKNKYQGISSHISGGTEDIAISDEIKMSTRKHTFENKYTDTQSLESKKFSKDRDKSCNANIDSNIRDIDTGLMGENTVMKSEKEKYDSHIADYPLRVSKLYIDNIETHHCLIGNTRESFFHIIQELVGLKLKKLNSYDVSPLLEITDKKTYETNYLNLMPKEEKNVQDEFKKKDDIISTEKLSDGAKRLLLRQKLVKPFLSSLNKGKENWIETYNFIYEDADSKEIFNFASSDFLREESNYVLLNPSELGKNRADLARPDEFQDSVYTRRWLKKLLNKLVNHQYSDHINITLSFTTDIINDLKKLSTSEKYDINHVDELMSNLILNGTVQYNYVLNSYILSSVYDSFRGVGFYIIISITLSVLLYFIMLYFPFSRIIFFFLLLIAWHGYKMYQEKKAEKHATVSGSSPAYCESILNMESGIFAQIKEFIRYETYNDHCKKYFEAIMIDPLSELSFSIVVSDFVSSTFFQVFRPMGRALNVLVKDLFYDLSFLQTFYMIVLLIFIFIVCITLTLIYNRYKLNFPFFLGSVEPSIASYGSRVEDIALERNFKKEFLKHTVSQNNHKAVKYDTKDHNISLKPLQNEHQPKISKSLMRRSSF